MATKMMTTGSVEFLGSVIELGKPHLFNGRYGVPFMAWVRDAATAYGPNTRKPHTDIRVKWTNTYMPSDFNDVHGKPVAIVPVTELAASA